MFYIDYSINRVCYYPLLRVLHPHLHLSLYQTFVLEEKHGFNKTTPSLYLVDILKSWGLGFTLGAPFLGAFLFVFKWAGDWFVPWLMGFLLSFQLIMVFLCPTVIQPFINKLSPLKDGDLRIHIESLASKLNFPLKYLYEINGSKWSSHSNAYFFGLPWVCSLLSSRSFIKLTLKYAEQAHCDIWHPN